MCRLRSGCRADGGDSAAGVLACVDALLTSQLHTVIIESVKIVLKSFLRFAVRRQRESLKDAVASCRMRIRQGIERERERRLAIEYERQAASRKQGEAAAAKVRAAAPLCHAPRVYWPVVTPVPRARATTHPCRVHRVFALY